MAKNLVNSTNIQINTSGDDINLDFTPATAQKIAQINTNTTDITGLKGQVLWTNPDPTKAISSELNITLSSGDYDFLEIITKQTTTDNRSYITKIPKGADGRIYVLTLSGTSAVRNIRYNSDTSYTFGTISGGASSTDATWCIPLYIVGYKTGLFS